MLRKFLLVFSLFSFSLSWAQVNRPEISEMKWGADFNIHITFSNDSTSIYEVKGLYHSNSTPVSSNDVTYYPVSLDQEFVDALKDRDLDSFVDGVKSSSEYSSNLKNATLWSALHNNLGGGWIHFINSLVYSLQMGSLSLDNPLMIRTKSDWKPSPMTQSYKRTKKWSNYVPTNQKTAQKEYKLKLRKNELGDIKLLPPSFIELFLATSQKDYELLVQKNQKNDIAIINMIRLLLGANYLGEEQISYVRGSVIKSIMKYNVNNLPSVIIFDDFDAAVAMTLSKDGYEIEKVVFNNESELTAEEIDQRIERMEGIIGEINVVNKRVFEKNLKMYYN